VYDRADVRVLIGDDLARAVVVGRTNESQVSFMELRLHAVARDDDVRNWAAELRGGSYHPDRDDEREHAAGQQGRKPPVVRGSGKWL